MVFKYSGNVYRPVLLGALKFRWLVVVTASILVIISIWLATRLGSEFIPQIVKSDIALHAMRNLGTGIDQAIDMQKLLETKIMKYQQVQTVFAKRGTAEVATDAMPPIVTDTFVMLKPRELWPDPSLSKQDFVAMFEKNLSVLLGNNYEFTQPIQMRFNELIRGIRADFGIKLFGDDLDTLVLSASEIFTINPKLVMLARYGLDVTDLQTWLHSAIGGNQAGLIFEGDRRFSLAVRFSEDMRSDLDAFGDIPIVTANSEYVALAEVAELNFSFVPSQIGRENGKRPVVVTANARQRDLGSFVK